MSKENIKLEENFNEKTTNKSKTTKSKSTTKKESEKETEVMDKQATVNLDIVEELQRKNEELQKQIQQLLALVNQTTNISTQSKKEKTYKIISLMSEHNVFTLKTTKGIIKLSGYEDYVEVSEEEFRDVIRDYYNLFKMGLLTTDSNGAKILKQRQINVANRWLTNEEIENLGYFDKNELVSLYKTLHPRQKEKLVEIYLKGINEGKKEFYDVDKLVALSKVYDGVLYRQRLNEAFVKISK